jgi:hypothetical protein
MLKSATVATTSAEAARQGAGPREGSVMRCFMYAKWIASGVGASLRVVPMLARVALLQQRRVRRLRDRRYSGRVAASLVLAAAAAVAASAQTIPPMVYSVSPRGVERGKTVPVTIEGRNLAGTRAVLFDSPAINAKFLSVRDLAEEKRVIRPGVDLGAEVPQGVKQEAKLEMTVAKDAEPGVHWFRVQTPLGSSNLVAFDIGELPEIEVAESTDAPQTVDLPATLAGAISSPGRVDTFQFQGKVGEELVFETVASELGSQLRSILTLRDSNGKILARAGEYQRRPDAVLTAKLPADGTYTVSITDLEKRGGGGFFYRLNAGPLPYVTEVFPLGGSSGKAFDVHLTGVNLGGLSKVTVTPPEHADGWQTVSLRVQAPTGPTLKKIRVGVGNSPEIEESEPNDSPDQAQRITVPVTLNGHIWSGKNSGPADEDYFRFSAHKGEHLVAEVAASRLGSPLDSVVEILDSKGHEIPFAVARAVAETTLTLGNRDSQTSNLRFTSVSGIRVNDYVMMGDELTQLIFVPDQPDIDLLAKNFAGEREALFNTSPQAHTADSEVYKVQLLRPGEEFPPNGLPVAKLTYRNDDGGPGYAEDSRLDFTAPEDGEYLLHIKDVRGSQGPDFAYRLTLGDANPDFRLTASPSNPNVPRGGRVPIEVTADRRPGYEGPIEVQVTGLPAGVAATSAVIPEGQDSTLVTLEASPDAPESSTPGGSFRVVGRATDEGRELVRVADADRPLRLVSLMPAPDLVVSAEPKEIVLAPGQEVPLTLHCDRRNGFAGRVPYQVANLPPSVVVADIGFTGGFVTEKESSRTVRLRAADWATALEQPIYIVGEVESDASTSHVSTPVVLKIVPKKQLAKATTSTTREEPASGAPH